jgi:hypothetical protein
MESETLSESIELAVRILSSIPYFPQDDYARLSVMEGIAQFANCPEGVRWMAGTALGHMRTWLGVPELRGIYCAGGFTPRDGRHETSSIPSLAGDSSPAYHLPAPVMQKRLPEPPTTPEEEAQLQAEMKQLQEKIDRAAERRSLKRLLFEKQYKPEDPPEWLKNLQ